MFCPNCGANNSTEQNFCRSCGLNLEKTSQSLLEQIPSAESAKFLKRQQKIEYFGMAALSGLGIVGLIGLGAAIYSILVKMILSGQNIAGGIFIIAALICAVSSLAFVIYWTDREDNDKRLKQVRNSPISGNRNTGNLLEEGNFEPVSSVTENTTDLLYAENKTRKLE